MGAESGFRKCATDWIFPHCATEIPVFSGLFGLGVIWFGLMYLLHMDEGIRTFDLLKIALLLMMGCLAHLCWRAMLVVEKR